MVRKLIAFSICAFVLACGKKKGDTVAQTDVIDTFDVSKLPKKITPNALAAEVLEQWPEYNALVSAMDALYSAKEREDVSLVINDLIDKEQLLAKSDYPADFKKPQILSRQAVFKTFVLKVKGVLTYNQELQEPSIELVQAYNALINQFSVLKNKYVDHDLILELDEISMDSIPKEIAPLIEGDK